MSLNWVTVIWSMGASACLTLAAMHFLVWSRKRTEWANLLFCLTAVGTAAVAYCELGMMRAETPAQFSTALRWLHVPTWVITVALVGFVLLHLRAGRPWLAWTICALRSFALLLNFLVGQNLNYREVTRLRHIPFVGESISVAEGVANPWMLVGQLSLVLLLVFVTDATIAVWRRGDGRLALVTGCSIVVFLVLGTVEAALVFWGQVPWPVTASLFFMVIVAAMAYEMSREVRRAGQLSDDLRESEERMALATEAAGVGVWMWSAARNQVWGSERWRRLFGFAPDADVKFEMVVQRIHPDDREMVEREVGRAVADQNAYVGEFRVELPDGTQRWIASRGRRYADENGKPTRMLGAALDITERKQAEEVLRQSAQKFHSLYESMRDAFAIVDIKGRFQEFNLVFQQLVGYPDEELRGLTYVDITPEHWHAFEARILQDQVLRRDYSDVYEKEYRKKDGTVIPVELRASLIRDESGQPVAMWRMVRDITERRKSEQEIAQQRSELAHLSRVTMLGELAGSLAHELNQPLAAILSNAQAAQDFLAGDSQNLDEVREILQDIVNDDKRAGEVIQGVRQLLKKGAMRREPFDMNEVVRDVLRLVRSDLVNAGVIVTPTYAPVLAIVVGDRVQLQQVLLNVVMNGCDAMSGDAKTDRELVVITELVDSEFIRVCVTDKGRGIAPENLERVFEPFFTTKAHGLGLGLSVCRQIISAHGGRLWAMNNAGRGASFYFTLPASSRDTA